MIVTEKYNPANDKIFKKIKQEIRENKEYAKNTITYRYDTYHHTDFFKLGAFNTIGFSLKFNLSTHAYLSRKLLTVCDPVVDKYDNLSNMLFPSVSPFEQAKSIYTTSFWSNMETDSELIVGTLKKQVERYRTFRTRFDNNVRNYERWDEERFGKFWWPRDSQEDYKFCVKTFLNVVECGEIMTQEKEMYDNISFDLTLHDAFKIYRKCCCS